MRGDPVFCAQEPLGQQPVFRAQIQLLRRGEADGVEPVQEGEGVQWGVGGGDGGEGLRGDAVGGVEDAFCGFGGRGGGGRGGVVAVDEEGGTLFRRGDQEGVRGEGDEEGGVVEERVFFGG